MLHSKLQCGSVDSGIVKYLRDPALCKKKSGHLNVSFI